MYLWPPRPERAIEPSLIQFYENKGWIAQLKKNGTCTVISIDADGDVEFWTRHKEAHKAWKPTPEITEFFSQFPNSVFVGELLHNKHPSVKNTIVLFDVLRYGGNDLVGMELSSRLGLLNLWREPNFTPALIPNIKIVENYSNGFRALYDGLTDPIDEGIVLKDPKAPLKSCLREGLNSGSMVKCRKSTKNFGF